MFIRTAFVHDGVLQIDDDGRKPESFKSLIKMSAPEWKYLAVGCFGSILYGTFPFLYGKAYGGLFDVSTPVIVILINHRKFRPSESLKIKV